MTFNFFLGILKLNLCFSGRYLHMHLFTLYFMKVDSIKQGLFKAYVSLILCMFELVAFEESLPAPLKTFRHRKTKRNQILRVALGAKPSYG